MLPAGEPIAVVGPNGSGKSTLAQVVAGHIPATQGKSTWFDTENQPIPEDDIFRHIGYAAPYLELVEEFTLLELLNFHSQFKPWISSGTALSIVDQLGLQKHQNKQIKYFSSGMKQRVKLGLAFFSESPFLFLDEPTANLDVQGVAWYLKNVQEVIAKRWVMICSNDPKEYSFASTLIDIRQLK